MTKKLHTLRSFSYSPFWEEIHEQWAHVFTPECTLADAIEELLATIKDLIAGTERGECTTAGLHFAAECFDDLVDVYALQDPWKRDLYDLVTTLDKATTKVQAAAIARRTTPRLRERLADERRKSE